MEYIRALWEMIQGKGKGIKVREMVGYIKEVTEINNEMGGIVR